MSKKIKCPECNGKGKTECITQEQSGFSCSYECPRCSGTGKMWCPRCNGTGMIEED